MELGACDRNMLADPIVAPVDLPLLLAWLLLFSFIRKFHCFHHLAHPAVCTRCSWFLALSSHANIYLRVVLRLGLVTQARADHFLFIANLSVGLAMLEVLRLGKHVKFAFIGDRFALEKDFVILHHANHRVVVGARVNQIGGSHGQWPEDVWTRRDGDVV